jgi:two-component system invasion response regulator UvrY
MLNFLIVDDHEMTRFGVRLLLTKHFSFNQIDEAASGNAALDLVKEHKYDLVILDMNMPGTDANQLIDNIMRASF